MKLATLKASLLTMAGRVQLIRSVAQSMLLHCLSIYSRHVSLIKDMEKWMRNFLASGDINMKKLVTVAWHKSCKPLKEGGLGIRNLSDINEAGNLKLCWEIVQSDLPWAFFVRSRVLRNKKPISYHISSSIWSSAKHKVPTILNNSSWLLGNEELINFWCDNWCNIPFVDLFNIPPHLHSSLHSTVSQFINNNNWCVPQDILQGFPNLQQNLNLVTIPLIQKEDKLIWKKSHDGSLSFKDAYLFQTASNHQHPSWSKIIWNAAIPPSKSLLTWRILHEKCQRTSISFKEDVKFPLSTACVPWLQNLQFIFF